MNPLNHNDQSISQNNGYNSWFYDSAVFNRHAYEEYVAEQQRKTYEQEQNIEVLKASKAFDDLLTELPKVDAAHQCQLRNACFAVLVKHGIKQGLY